MILVVKFVVLVYVVGSVVQKPASDKLLQVFTNENNPSYAAENSTASYVTRGLWSLGFLMLVIQLAGPAYALKPAVKKPGPDEVLQVLKEGNQRFYTGKATYPHTDFARLAQAGTEDQRDHAYATVITCSDSRVPVELIFDAGVMDIFVIRVAGNVANTDEIGSIEYGLAHVNTPVLVVLGHTQCGAVTAVTHAVQGEVHRFERNIPPLVDNIIPAVKRAIDLHPNAHGDAIVPYAILENVWQSIEDLFMASPASRNMVKEGKAMVVGAIYDVGTGKVTWLPLEKVHEILKKVEASPAKETEPYAN
jgi:carbonic anhydrase